MKVCAWCEGKKVVGQLAHAEEPKSATVCGVVIPVIGTMLDVCCKVCRGRGEVPDDLDVSRRIREIQAKAERKS
jgi:hypothetical protein